MRLRVLVRHALLLRMHMHRMLPPGTGDRLWVRLVRMSGRLRRLHLRTGAWLWLRMHMNRRLLGKHALLLRVYEHRTLLWGTGYRLWVRLI